MNSKNRTDVSVPKKSRVPWRWLLPGTVVAGIGAVIFFQQGTAAGHRLVCPIQATPFLETLGVSGEVDTDGFQEVRAPEAPYDRQVTWLAPEGLAVKQGDIIAQFDIAPAQEHLEWEEDRVDALEDVQETETITWDINLSTEKVRKDQREETLQSARMRKEGSLIEPPLPREISELKFGVANLTVDEAARRIKQLERMSAVELSRRKHHIKYRETRVDRDKAYLETYVVRSPVDSVILYPPIPLAGGVVRKVEAGDYLEREQVFGRLPDFSSQVVRLKIPERAIQKVAEEATLTFRARAFPGEQFQAKVVSISKLAFESTNHPHQKFFDVVAEILPGNGSEKLSPGMVVEAGFPVHDHGIVFAIPKDLAKKNMEGAYLLPVETPDGKTRTVSLREGVTELEDYLLVPPRLLDNSGTIREIRVIYSPEEK